MIEAGQGNLHEALSADHVQVGVGEGADVCGRLPDRLLLPELVTEHVPASSKHSTVFTFSSPF